MAKLKSCPACEKHEAGDECCGPTRWRIACRCGQCGSWRATNKDAREAWNALPRRDDCPCADRMIFCVKCGDLKMCKCESAPDPPTLKPCPFCGGEAERATGDRRPLGGGVLYAVGCHTLSCRGNIVKMDPKQSQEITNAHWNRRAGDAD